MKEEVLLTSPLEYTNEPYAIAKIAGLKMCESFNLQYGTNYIAVMPTNLYGPNDNFDLERSHVLPAMIRKIHLAHCLKVVGDGDDHVVESRVYVGHTHGTDLNNLLLDCSSFLCHNSLIITSVAFFLFATVFFLPLRVRALFLVL